MIEVANPNAGALNQGATMLLYQTWTPDDCKKVCADILKPDVDVSVLSSYKILWEVITQMGLRLNSLDDSTEP